MIYDPNRDHPYRISLGVRHIYVPRLERLGWKRLSYDNDNNVTLGRPRDHTTISLNLSNPNIRGDINMLKDLFGNQPWVKTGSIGDEVYLTIDKDAFNRLSTRYGYVLGKRNALTTLMRRKNKALEERINQQT